MAEAVILEAKPRQGRGSQTARKLRRQGLVPAVLYGHKETTTALALMEEELRKALRHSARVVDLKTDGNLQKALIKEVQWDHLGKELLHIDFARVAADERVTVPVAVEIRGTAPGVSAGGLLDQPIHTLQVECLATAVPEHIRVNVNELQIGQAIHVRDLHLPPDVKVLADPEAIVVHVTAPLAEPAPTAAPLAEQAEPEVIGRQRPAEEEEGE